MHAKFIVTHLFLFVNARPAAQIYVSNPKENPKNFALQFQILCDIL